MRKDSSYEIIMSKPRIIALQVLYWILFLQVFVRFLPRMLFSLGVSIEDLPLVFQWVDYFICMVIAIVIAFPILKKERNIDIGKLVQTIIIAIGAMFLMNIIFTIFMSLFSLPTTSNNETGLDEIVEINRFLYLTMVVIIAPVLEEIVFRGGIFRVIRSYKNFWIAALVSALLFGFIHVSSSLFAQDYIDIIYLILYSGLGFVLCFVYEYNHSIYASIVVHMLYNLLGSAYLLF